MPSDGYYAARALAAQLLPDVRFAPTAGPYPSFDGASLVLLESPANPGLAMCDLPALGAAARAAGALVAVDNTTATPLGQRPLDLGADISVGSGTKLAMECGIALSEAVVAHAETSAERAFAEYEAARRTPCEVIQHNADVSLAWFEHMGRSWDMEPMQFAMVVMCRAKSITWDNLLVRDEGFVRAFEDEWYSGEAIDTLVLTEKGGKTTATLTMLLGSKAARDMALKSGMETGVAQSYDVLDTVLASIAPRTS